MIARLVASTLLLAALAGSAVAATEEHDPCNIDVRDYCGDPYVAHLLQEIVSTRGDAALVSTGGKREPGFAVALVTDRQGRHLVRVYECTNCAMNERHRDWAQHVQRIQKLQVEIPVELSYRSWAIVQDAIFTAKRKPLDASSSAGEVNVLAVGFAALPIDDLAHDPNAQVVSLMRALRLEALRIDAFQDASRLASLEAVLHAAEQANPVIRRLRAYVPAEDPIILETHR